MRELVEQLLLKDADARLENRSDGLWLVSPRLDVEAMAHLMLANETRLSTITAVALNGGETELIYHYQRAGQAVNIKTITHGNTIASITPVTRSAGWIEREIHDLYAVVFTGHPNLDRLIRPPEMPVGFFRPENAQS